MTVSAGTAAGSGVGGDMIIKAGDHGGSATGGTLHLKTYNSGGTVQSNAVFSNTLGTSLGGILQLNSADTVTSAGAASLTTAVTLVNTTSGSFTVTLADGVAGQLKTFVLIVDGGNLIITPSTYTGGTSVTHADVGDSTTFLYADSTRKWVVIANNGGAIS